MKWGEFRTVCSRGVIRFAHQRGVSLRSRGVDFVQRGVLGCALEGRLIDYKIIG